MNIHVPGMTLRAALARQSHQTLLPWQTTISSQSYSSSMPTTTRERERENIETCFSHCSLYLQARSSGARGGGWQCPCYCHTPGSHDGGCVREGVSERVDV